MEAMSFQSMRVLLLDDTNDNFEKVRSFLGDDYEIMRVDSVGKVISHLSSENNRIVLVAVILSNYNTEAHKLMKNMRDHGFANMVPVVGFGVDLSDEVVDTAYAVGMADFIDFGDNTGRTNKRLRYTVESYVRSRTRERRLAENDALTGALNIHGLRRRFEDKIRNSQMDNVKYVFVYADIQNFKYFNSTFGFDVGNYLLKYWFETVKKHSAAEDLVCRISGDQMVVITSIREKDEHSDKSDKILEDVRNHFANEFGDYTIHIVSGVFIYDPCNNRGEDFDQIIGYARQAQKVIKEKGGSGLAIYDDEMWAAGQRKIEITGHVEAGIANGEVSVYMQPQYNCVTGEIIGAECLCRWNHETLGWISPAEFIPALEESGKIYLLDRYVWETACCYMKKWKDMGYEFSLSVNISRVDIKYADLPTELLALVSKYDLTPDKLRIEITESAYMDRTEPLNDLIHTLSEIGFMVEMDDFGSGYSSLNMLHSTQVDILKLDMGFLNDSQRGGRGGSIINALVKMAHALNIRVLAEGVETRDQADFLKNIGCLMVQGYYFSKPLPIDEFEKLVFNSTLTQIAQNYDKYNEFNLQELFDRKSSGFFLFNQCMGPALLFDVQNDVVHPVVVNTKFCNLINWERNKVETDAGMIFTRFDKDIQTAVWKAMEECEGQDSAQITVYSKKLDKYIHAMVKHVGTRAGVDMFFSECFDVSAQKRLEREVTDLIKNFKSVFEVPGVTICEYIPKTDKMIFNYKDEDGVESERICDDHLKELSEHNWIHEDSRENYTRALKEAVASGMYHNTAVCAKMEDDKYYKCRYHFSPIISDEGQCSSVVIRVEKIELAEG